MGGIPIDGARQGEAAGQFGDRRPLCRRRHHRRP
jgi:hypothetical protein